MDQREFAKPLRRGHRAEAWTGLDPHDSRAGLNPEMGAGAFPHAGKFGPERFQPVDTEVVAEQRRAARPHHAHCLSESYPKDSSWISPVKQAKSETLWVISFGMFQASMVATILAS